MFKYKKNNCKAMYRYKYNKYINCSLTLIIVLIKYCNNTEIFNTHNNFVVEELLNLIMHVNK